MSTDTHSGNKKKTDACPRRIELLQAMDPDIPGERLDAVRAHALGCPRCSGIVSRLEAENTEFIARHPPGTIVPRLLARAAGTRHKRRLLQVLAPAAAAALALLVLLVAQPANHEPGPVTTRVKGEVSLRFFVQRGGQSVEARSGEIFHAGDRIQFVYTSGAKRYLFLASLDDEGRLSNFNFQAAPSSVPIVPGNGQVLEGSIILDDHLGPERVFAVFSDRPLPQAEIERAAARAFSLLRREGGDITKLMRLPLSHPQASVLLEKK
ncbi:MAG TPA: hypothetical protein VM425_05375 [Myxococcota bacterium]|nr:hypothetical protein [Myxococcota bacterium]